VKIASCQTPDIRNDVSAATLLIEEFATEAQQRGAHLICFPECFLQGYTSDREACNEIAIDLGSPTFNVMLRSLSRIETVIVVGLVERAGRFLYNSAVVIEKGDAAFSQLAPHSPLSR